MTLTSADLEALPVVTVHMDGGVEVLVRPQAYMDALGKDNAYAPRCDSRVRTSEPISYSQWLTQYTGMPVGLWSLFLSSCSAGYSEVK